MGSNLPKYIPKVCYEIFVRSFCDSNGDGIGDLSGIIHKLDYLQDLGIEAIWLTPIHPSPSYHKYDVRDFYDVDKEFGTLDDFKRLLAEAHQRDIAVYLDLIVNHTSTEHPWFEEARKGHDNPFREFYWWMTPEKIDEMGIGKRETSADSDEVYPWHDNPGDPEQYYGLFYSGMPDLNYDSTKLRIALSDIIHYWLIEIGVDGFRLDAARHIYPTWVKFNNQHFWWFFDYFVRNIRPEAFTIGEIWATAEEVAPYFKNLNSAFHFDVSFALQRILMSGKDEKLVDRLQKNYALFSQYNADFIDAIMLTNHDQDRIGSVVANDERKIKLAASLLLTLPGQLYMYYGEEIGMLGTKPDPYIREPFLWSENPEDPENTYWEHAEFSTLKTIRPLSLQQKDRSSVFWHYKRLIALRKREPALGQILHPNIRKVSFDDNEVMIYDRPHENRTVRIIHNLSGDTKTVPFENASHQYPVLYETYPVSFEEDKLTLPPYCSLILLMTTDSPDARDIA